MSHIQGPWTLKLQFRFSCIDAYTHDAKQTLIIYIRHPDKCSSFVFIMKHL